MKYFLLQALNRLDWSGPSCFYRILYRLNVPSATWNNNTRVFGDCSKRQHNHFQLQPNSEYEIAIRAENSKGIGPSSPIVKVLSGQSRPVAPTNVTVVLLNASAVKVLWSAIQVVPPKTVDGYWVCNPHGIPPKINGIPPKERSKRSLYHYCHSFLM